LAKIETPRGRGREDKKVECRKLEIFSPVTLNDGRREMLNGRTGGEKNETLNCNKIRQGPPGGEVEQEGARGGGRISGGEVTRWKGNMCVTHRGEGRRIPLD